MKNILIIRSANMTVLDKMINHMYEKYGDEKYKIYILIQNGLIADFQKKYPNISCIGKEDGFFNYRLFKKNTELINELKKINFSNIYIPSSGTGFDGFYDTFLIAASINSKEKCILFNKLGEIQEVKLNRILVLIDKYFSNIIYMMKAFIALIIVIICYMLYFPYFRIKNLVSSNKER